MEQAVDSGVDKTQTTPSAIVAKAFSKISLSTIRAEKAARSYYEFVKQSWPIVEPGRSFIDGWHIQAICEHLEAVAAGHIRKLIINIPPRHMKSLLSAVMFPAWTWIHTPVSEWLTASYSLSLSIRDAAKARQIIESDWYKANWPHVQMREDQNSKSNYKNTHGGARIAVSVGSQVTGYGGDYLLVDDPINADEANSPVIRQQTIEWYTSTFFSRANDPDTAAFIVIMQRLHANDLAGYLLQHEKNHELLCLRAVALA